MLFGEQGSLLSNYLRLLSDQLLQNCYKLSIALEPLGLIKRSQFFLPIRHQSRSIQMKQANRKSAFFGQCFYCAVIQCDKMGCGLLLARIPKRWIGRGFGPIVSLILVAPNTTIDKILQTVISTFANRVEMVNCQQTPSIRLMHTAVFASKVGACAHLIADIVAYCHMG